MPVNSQASYEDVESLGPIINEILMRPEQNLEMEKAAKMVGMSYSHFPDFFPEL